VRFPVIAGGIKRRILVNFRVAPEVIQHIVRYAFRSKPTRHREYCDDEAMFEDLSEFLERSAVFDWPGWQGSHWGKSTGRPQFRTTSAYR
jgi:hypothetical protein